MWFFCLEALLKHFYVERKTFFYLHSRGLKTSLCGSETPWSLILKLLCPTYVQHSSSCFSKAPMLKTFVDIMMNPATVTPPHASSVFCGMYI